MPTLTAPGYAEYCKLGYELGLSAEATSERRSLLLLVGSLSGEEDDGPSGGPPSESGHSEIFVSLSRAASRFWRPLSTETIAVQSHPLASVVSFEH